jgi:3-hydroxyisobutyrate dehydrogenase
MFWEGFPIQWADLAKQVPKLAINYLLGLNLQGLAETIIFAEKWRSKEDMLSIINEGAWEWYNKYQSQLHFKRQLSRSFPLKHLVKI